MYYKKRRGKKDENFKSEYSFSTAIDILNFRLKFSESVHPANWIDLQIKKNIINYYIFDNIFYLERMNIPYLSQSFMRGPKAILISISFFYY